MALASARDLNHLALIAIAWHGDHPSESGDVLGRGGSVFRRSGLPLLLGPDADPPDRLADDAVDGRGIGVRSRLLLPARPGGLHAIELRVKIVSLGLEKLAAILTADTEEVYLRFKIYSNHP